MLVCGSGKILNFLSHIYSFLTPSEVPHVSYSKGSIFGTSGHIFYKYHSLLQYSFSFFPYLFNYFLSVTSKVWSELIEFATTLLLSNGPFTY